MQKRLLVGAILFVGLGGLAAVKMTEGKLTEVTTITNALDNANTKVAKPLTLETSFEFPTPKPLPAFELIDQHGRPFTNANLLNTWSLFFVGYTACPDVCPTTMSKLSAAYPSLKQNGPLQVIFLSVDPARDTPEKLLSYTEFFNPEFIALTSKNGDHATLMPLTRSLGIVYSMVGEGDDYQVDHSSSLVLVSPAGERVAVIKPTISAGKIPQIRNQALIADMQQLMQQNRR